MKKSPRHLCCLLALSVSACVTGLLDGGGAPYDARRVSLQFLSLYNQRFPLVAKHRKWQGDWVLRRERLSMIDKELLTVKPDLVIVQEMMAKKASSYESDIRILGAGALAGYAWQKVDVAEYEDTQELESMAVATGLPLRVMAEGQDNSLMWTMGQEGVLSVFSVLVEDQPLTIFNVKLPAKEAKQGLWFKFMHERISQYMSEHRRCSQRLVVAGLLEVESDQADYRKFLDGLGLVDVSQGFCELESRCYTATPLNDLYRAIEGDHQPQRSDRILVHESTLVYSSARNFHERKKDQHQYARAIGLDALWPSPRFGWIANVRLARCHESSLLGP